MAGLIQQQMAGGAGAPAADAPAPEEQMPQGQMTPGEGGDEGAPDENNPEFLRAMQYALQVLYEKKAAGDIAKQLRSAQDKQEALGNIAYEVTSVVDERTEGSVPRELIGLLAMAILNEVVEIGEAANLQIKPEDAAGAFKDMLLRYLGENGVDTAQLQQAMGQVDPSVFAQG